MQLHWVWDRRHRQVRPVDERDLAKNWVDRWERSPLALTGVQGALVSTVFLEIDHGLGATPRLFESAVWSPVLEPWRGRERRYHTRRGRRVLPMVTPDVVILGRYATPREAMRGHRAIVRALENLASQSRVERWRRLLDF